jgi:glycosyltransferase involved in cell wall biosynthesis
MKDESPTKTISIVKAGDVTFISRLHRLAASLETISIYKVNLISIEPRDLPVSEVYKYNSIKVPIKLRKYSSIFFLPLRVIEGFWRVFRACLSSKSDLFIAAGFEDLFLVWIASFFLKANFIYIANELEGDRNRVRNPKLNKRVNKLVIRLERLILKKAKYTIAADYERAKVMEDWYGIDKIEVLRNVPNFQDIENKGLIKSKLNLAESDKVLLYQGIVAPGRGIEVGIKGCAGIESDRIHFVILGFYTEGYKKKLLKVAEESNFKNIHFLEPVPWKELLSWTASCDISFVLIENISISYYLAAPNKLYETIMVNKPYIASDFPEIRRVHAIANSGIIVDPENVIAISGAIKKLLEDQGFYDKCVSNSKIVRKELNWEVEQNKLFEFVEASVK